MIQQLELLRSEIEKKPTGCSCIRNLLYAKGYRTHFSKPNVLVRAYGFAAMLQNIEKVVYPHDLIVGSVRGLLSDRYSAAELTEGDRLAGILGSRGFWTNFDHFAPDYATFLSTGVQGVLQQIEFSLKAHSAPEEQNFLNAAQISMQAFSQYISDYADAAAAAGLTQAAENCRAVMLTPPQSFRQALQLMWLVHTVFYCENRYAMALGRMDQFLFPFYQKDLQAGSLTKEEALALVACTLYKIRESVYFGGDNVVNIAIGGVKRDGSDAINELSYLILEAVHQCNIPGPNLSARLHPAAPPEFLDACLQVIGTGLGYPALMNDAVNIPALARQGYTLADARDYCMVGCIENFIPGKQPPWSDGRFNTPKYLELALNNGVCMLTGVQKGPRTGEAESLTTMEQLMQALEAQMRYGAAEYMFTFTAESNRYQPLNYQQPFLSCFCADCIHRAKDICNGGAYYPSVHGAGTMGIATMADSLSAIEKLVYTEKVFTLAQLRDMLRVDYEGFEEERQMLLAVPKYGNDCPETDKYAAWFVRFQDELFSEYRTYDGGPVYIAIASNTSNIPAGKEIAATPDGRHALQPVSDAASPMHGRDVKGPTAAIKSLTVPDYTHSSCGTVVNQKYSPEMFTDPEKRKLLASIIRTYFARGGQEMQINSVSRAVLMDAREHPEDYRSLVVRVSGFSAYYTQLIPEVQQDILDRTEQS